MDNKEFNKEEFEDKMIGLATNEKMIYTIPFEKPNIFQKLFKKDYKEFVVRKHTSLDQNTRISKILKRIPLLDTNADDMEIVKKNIEIMADNTEDVISMICVLFKTNKRKFLLENLGSPDLLAIVMDMLAMLDVQSFMTSIILTGSKVSPTAKR